MSQQLERHHTTDDEIDLVDVWLAVRRHKVTFLGAFILSALAGVALALFMPTKFEHSIVLEIGVRPGGATLAGRDNDGFELIEEPESVREKIVASYVPEEVRRLQTESPSASVPNDVGVKTAKGTRIVTLSVSASAGAAASVNALLGNVADRVLLDHNASLSRRVDLLREVALERLQEVEAQLEFLQDSRRQVAASGAAAEKALTLLMVDSQMQRLSAEKSAIERELRVDLGLEAQPTRIVVGPLRELRPESPGPLLLIALSLLVGVVLGFGVVLFAAIRQRASERSAG